MSTLKLYMPLNITTTDASGERFQLVGKGTLVCEEAVSTAIKQFDENGPDCGSRGRMSCFHCGSSVEAKVSSLVMSVEPVGQALWGVAVCEINEPLTAGELTELKSFVEGDMSDGWGEGFSQRPIALRGGSIHASFWDWKIGTAEEFAQGRTPGFKAKLKEAAQEEAGPRGPIMG